MAATGWRVVRRARGAGAVRAAGRDRAPARSATDIHAGSGGGADSRRRSASRRPALCSRAAAAAITSTRRTSFSSRARWRFCASSCAASARSNTRAKSKPSAGRRWAIAIARSSTSRTDRSATSRRARTRLVPLTGDCPISSPRLNQALGEMRDAPRRPALPALRAVARIVHQRDRGAGERARNRPSGGAVVLRMVRLDGGASITPLRWARSASARGRSSR